VWPYESVHALGLNHTDIGLADDEPVLLAEHNQPTNARAKGCPWDVRPVPMRGWRLFALVVAVALCLGAPAQGIASDVRVIEPLVLTKSPTLWESGGVVALNFAFKPAPARVRVVIAGRRARVFRVPEGLRATVSTGRMRIGASYRVLISASRGNSAVRVMRALRLREVHPPRI